jgi:hypothetical protein
VLALLIDATLLLLLGSEAIPAAIRCQVAARTASAVHKSEEARESIVIARVVHEDRRRFWRIRRR